MTAAPPAIPDELFEEILLRLPPDNPACLLRASLVCKAWGCAVSLPGFRRRLHELHRAAPVLGFLHGWDDDHIPHFAPTTASSFSLAAPDNLSWRALDCRHGRALFRSKGDAQELLLWEPTTGAQQRLSVPTAYDIIYPDAMVYPNAAVLCAADGCDHHDCLGGPFRVVFVYSVDFEEFTDDEEFVTWACVYSSDTGTWGELTSLTRGWPMCFTFHSSVLVGGTLLYFMCDDGFILEYDLARHGLTVFDPPRYEMYLNQYNIMLAEDGGLGVNEVMNPHLKLWARKVSDSTDARWVLSRAIDLGNLLPIGALVDADRTVQVLGFAEGANVIFVTTFAGLFTIELRSDRVRKVRDHHGSCNLIPVVSFYTPLPRGEHKDPYSKPSEDAGGQEGGGEEEKTVDLAHQLVNNGSNVTNEGDFVNAFECVSHAIENRVPPYGKVAVECTSTVYGHGCCLLYEAQEVTGPLGDVPKSAPNEESVKSSGTASKDDAGNS